MADGRNRARKVWVLAAAKLVMDWAADEAAVCLGQEPEDRTVTNTGIINAGSTSSFDQSGTVTIEERCTYTYEAVSYDGGQTWHVNGPVNVDCQTIIHE